MDIVTEFETMRKLLQQKQQRLIEIAGTTGQGFSVLQVIGICEELDNYLKAAIARSQTETEQGG